MDTNIKRNVMRRVRTIHLLQPLLSSTAFALVVCAASLYAIGRLVFVAQVFRNMPRIEDLGAVIRFFLSALMHTDAPVQLLTAAVLLALVWIVKDAVKLVQLPRMA